MSMTGLGSIFLLYINLGYGSNESFPLVMVTAMLDKSANWPSHQPQSPVAEVHHAIPAKPIRNFEACHGMKCVPC